LGRAAEGSWSHCSPPTPNKNRVTAASRDHLARARTHDWRTRASRALGAWHAVALLRARDRSIQQELTWHHVQHVQAAAWRVWRRAFELRSRHHRLLRYAYVRRGRAVARRAVVYWRGWAPVMRAKRRRERDVLAAMARWRRGRAWGALRAYTLERREVRLLKARAHAHFRSVWLRRHLQRWTRVFELQAALEGIADAFAARSTTRRLAAALGWWRSWRTLQVRKRQWRAQIAVHMTAGTQARVLAAWRARVVRRARLAELEQLARAASTRAAARAALHAWWDRVGVVATWREATAAIAARQLHATMGSAFGAWRGHAAAKRRDQEAFGELVRHDVLRVWGGAWGQWRAALAMRRRLRHARSTLRLNKRRRLLVHWKARVDYKADWRAFAARAVQRLQRRRLSACVSDWHQVASRQALLQGLLSDALAARKQQRLAAYMGAWRAWLVHKVSKRMKALSALLHWERSLTRRAVSEWMQRTAEWRGK